MNEADNAIKTFLQNRDLGVLGEKGVAFPKASHFSESQHYFAVKWFMWLGCVPCLAPIATFAPARMYPHFALELHSDHLEVTFPVNVCCGVSVKTTKVPLDSIMDVTLNAEDKYNKPFGLKQIDVWAYGDNRQTGPSASIPWIADPEQAREAILLAVSLRKAVTGRVPYPPEALPASLEEANAASGQAPGAGPAAGAPPAAAPAGQTQGGGGGG